MYYYFPGNERAVMIYCKQPAVRFFQKAKKKEIDICGFEHGLFGS
jgi:hypothetical protein